MSKLLKCLITSGLIAAVGVPDSLACSRVLSNANGKAIITARTMDLDRPDRAQMSVSPRGMKRTSDTGKGPPLRWTSKYGSVAVTGAGALTSDGMNELNFAPGSGERTVDAYDASLAGDITRRLNQSESR